MRNKIISAIGLGVMFFWLSLFLSYRELPFEFDADDCECAYQNTLAIGGFPLQTFEYGLVGNDWPTPIGWEFPFFGNLAFWIAIGFVVASLRGEKNSSHRWMYLFVVASLFIAVVGILYLMFLFD